MIESSDVTLAAAAAAASQDSASQQRGGGGGMAASLGGLLGIDLGGSGADPAMPEEVREYLGGEDDRRQIADNDEDAAGGAGASATGEGISAGVRELSSGALGALRGILGAALGAAVATDVLLAAEGRAASMGGGGGEVSRGGGAGAAAAGSTEVLKLAHQLHAIVMRNRQLEADLGELEKEVRGGGHGVIH